LIVITRGKSDRTKRDPQLLYVDETEMMLQLTFLKLRHFWSTYWYFFITQLSWPCYLQVVEGWGKYL